MIPSVRSRMWASGTAFAAGFVMANYGILVVPRPDHVVWLAAAIVLMVTGALGVLFADSQRRLSIWTVLGMELLLGFTLLPLGWIFSLAVGSPTNVGAGLVPREPSWQNFSAVFESDALRDAAVDTVVVVLASTFVSFVVGGLAAYGLNRHDFRGSKMTRGLIVAFLFLPLVTIVGPLADQSLAFGLYDTRWVMVFAYLALTLPVATWLLVRLFDAAPWGLFDAARADGATKLQLVRRTLLPAFGPGLVTVFFVVFFAGWNFLLFGLGLGLSGSAQTFPATLATFDSEFDNASAAIAAATFVWSLPVLLFILIFHRRIAQILTPGKA